MGFIDAPLKESKAHPEHPIQLTKVDRPFYCDGCDEPGIGRCYQCIEPPEKCDKIFHEECGRAEEITSHPFSRSGSCHFIFYRPNKDGAGSSSQVIHRICDVCCTEVKGFYYVCCKHEKPHGHFIHPSCIKLQNRIQIGGFELELKGTVQGKCGLCGHKRVFDKMKGWSYVSTCGSQDLCLHIKCVKAIFLDDWKKMHFSHPNLLAGGSGSSSSSSSTSASTSRMTMVAWGTSGAAANTTDSGEAIVLYSGKTSFSVKKHTAKFIKLVKVAFPAIISVIFGKSVESRAEDVIKTLTAD